MAQPGGRIDTYEAFWPYYVGEHRDPRCRWLHFVGTTGFLGFVVASLATDPLQFGPAILGAGVVGALAWRLEGRRNMGLALLAMIALAAAANPLILGGVLFAYLFAWLSHFLIEKNRPATFQYPLWSLGSDFRMYSWMLRGRLWRGDGADIAGPRVPAAQAG